MKRSASSPNPRTSVSQNKDWMIALWMRLRVIALARVVRVEGASKTV
jgi:hypothetical protein